MSEKLKDQVRDFNDTLSAFDVTTAVLVRDLTPDVQAEAKAVITWLAEIAHLRAENELLREALEEEQRLRKSMLTLLYTDHVFVGSHWESYPDADAGVKPMLCAHVPNYAADAEAIPEDEINPLAELVAQFGDGAVLGWVCFKLGTDKPPKGGIGEAGEKALAFLRASRARKALEGE